MLNLLQHLIFKNKFSFNYLGSQCINISKNYVRSSSQSAKLINCKECYGFNQQFYILKISAFSAFVIESVVALSSRPVRTPYKSRNVSICKLRAVI